MTGRDAYVERYSQEPPPGAIFGVDLSYWQGGGNYNATRAIWETFADWASWVTIRTTYGRSGLDGADDAHLQVADDIGYPGSLGAYHYIVPGAGQANAGNFLARWARHRDRYSHEMLDEEEAGLSSSVTRSIMDQVEQTTQREGLYYASKSVADAAGWTSPRWAIWGPHYATSRYQAWSPTADWSEWRAPYVPNAWAQDAHQRLIWQYTSTSSQYGSLDLNVTTYPELVGLGGTGTGDAPMSAAEVQTLLDKLEQIVTMVAGTDSNGAGRATELAKTVVGARDYLHAEIASWVGVREPGKNHPSNLVEGVGNVNGTLSGPGRPGLVAEIARVTAAQVPQMPGMTIDFERFAEAVVDELLGRLAKPLTP